MRISLLSACLGTWIGLTFACSFLKSLQTACKKEHGQDLVVKGTSHTVGKMLKVLGGLWHMDPNSQRSWADPRDEVS